ncbi:MAG: phenylalanine--tRNA ligase subunit beta [Patescibacteria group bacterium]|nr:phenylalanine--tRNA ligase subunit beta [Patescibacteria group bacterium]
MNILASYNWIKEYVRTRESAENFARKLSLCGPAIERSYPQAPQFEKMVIGKVLGIKPHPNADKLRLVRVDIGKRKIDLVCGGVNLVEGMKVVVALVGSKVRWHGQGDLVELQPAEIRGVKSEGMICAANEIGLEDAFPHDDKEIMDVSWLKSKPGAALAKAFGLDDTVFDIEVTTNRPDAFCIVGLAREAAAILGAKFTWKEPFLAMPAKVTNRPELTVKVQAPKLCTRYQAVVMDKIQVGPSPWWLKNRLRLAGVRPINNVVDITNYVMLEYGQPMHAFDYDRLAGHGIVVRQAKAGEKLLLLDGRTVDLALEHLVIADAEKPVAVAGVMGGEESAVHADTKTIVFEAATFNPVSVRRTARSLNTHSDSSLRFEKGLPEELTQAALARAVELCQEAACGRVVSEAFDERADKTSKTKFPFRPVKAEALIGIHFPRPRMLAILKSLGFAVGARAGSKNDPRYEVTVPYWRERDIEGERDFAEEIARVYGYHNLPARLPTGEIPVELPSPELEIEDRLRDLMKGAGFTETLNYSFVSGSELEKCGFDPGKLLRVANPLSVEFEYMRPSLVPGMLTVIKSNEGLFPSGRVFEVSNVYLWQRGPELPVERPQFLTVVYDSGRTPADAERRYREVKGVLESVASAVGLVGVIMERPAEGAIWHPGRSAAISASGERVGAIGEIHPGILQKFGIDGGVAAMELDLPAALAAARPVQRYQPTSPFPPARRDLAFVVGERVEYASVEAAVRGAAPLLKEIELFDIYRGANLGEGKKSLALHLTFADPSRTLTAEEADAAVAGIMKSLAEKFGAIQRA